MICLDNSGNKNRKVLRSPNSDNKKGRDRALPLQNYFGDMVVSRKSVPLFRLPNITA
jgi:hypothetical protein